MKLNPMYFLLGSVLLACQTEKPAHEMPKESKNTRSGSKPTPKIPFQPNSIDSLTRKKECTQLPPLANGDWLEEAPISSDISITGVCNPDFTGDPQARCSDGTWIDLKGFCNLVRIDPPPQIMPPPPRIDALSEVKASFLQPSEEDFVDMNTLVFVREVGYGANSPEIYRYPNGRQVFVKRDGSSLVGSKPVSVEKNYLASLIMRSFYPAGIAHVRIGYVKGPPTKSGRPTIAELYTLSDEIKTFEEISLYGGMKLPQNIGSIQFVVQPS